MRGSKVFALCSFIFLIITIIGATLALAYYRSDITNVTLKYEENLGSFINYNNGTPILGGDNAVLNASSSYIDGLSTEIEFWKVEEAKNMDIYGHIYLDVNTGSSALLEEPGLKWTVTSGDMVISEGNFVGYSQGDSVVVLINQKLLTKSTFFRIYIWLDENELVNTDISGEALSLVVRCEATSVEYGSIGNLDGLFVFNEYNFDYSGNIDEFTVPNNGLYRLEVWGSQGGYGYNNTYRGGYGGYSRGDVYLTSGDVLYIGVGGAGGNREVKNALINAGGFNGGGNSYGTANKYVGSGGGATHIALRSGVLSSLESYLSDILIVSGGGGAGAYESASYNSTGGDGGGYIGNSGTTTNTSYIVGSGGSQIAAGSGYITAGFGQGANAVSDSIGGGGGFYGGGGGKYSSGSGGGSGYIGNSRLFNKSMYCFECSESSDADNKTIATSNVSDTATSFYAKMGNGYVRITHLFSSSSVVREVYTYGTDYDFKEKENVNMPSGYSVIYSTYDNVNLLDVGEYQIKFILLEESTNNKYTYYKKVEVTS